MFLTELRLAALQNQGFLFIAATTFFKEALQGHSTARPSGPFSKPVRRPFRLPNPTLKQTENGCLLARTDTPTIRVNQESLQHNIDILTPRGLICRFLGPRIHQGTIEQWVLKHWSKTGDTTVMFYSNGYFLALFEIEEERDENFQTGLWFLGNSGLYMKLWHRDFRPSILPSSASVWVASFLCNFHRAVKSILRLRCLDAV